MDIQEKLIEYISSLTDAELFELWNNYCDTNRYYDDRIEYVADIDMFEQGTASDILSHIDLNEFNLNDTYMHESIYGWQSFGYLDDEKSPIYIPDMVRYIVNSENSFGDSEIDDILMSNYDDEE